jgi:uncharacterized LabA/DUF88 family protein
MSDRVAVYIDFDNVVISRYDNIHGDGAWRKDQARDHRRSLGSSDPVDVKLAEAEIDISAIIDYAASFGTVALSRAYADWSVPANAAYKTPLVNRSIDLVQLFSTSGLKNGADIRLAVDAVEDMFRLPDLTHVVIVAGDSDYIALAQRCKRLGRYVVGIGVAGSSSRSLAAACDDFVIYDALPGVPVFEPNAEPETDKDEPEPQPKKRAPRRRATRPQAVEEEPEAPDPQTAATGLLERALRIGLEKDDVEWLHNSAVKAQMKRMDPSFSEKSLGFRSFSDFLRSRSDVVELDESSTTRMVRLKGS